ncbi:preprotein translocase subunit SecG [Phyllobacterium salinisoli]|uniref:Protein-export membrane protein SecG n=1 Tax=Phyllobacterium salinisoli TaxID=1899321 RepID=A0A368K560_9HYPH|nr:preprotein translocase subunit SecG [Phyllobacterium salinisoli]RCS24324.1 preprotein translocase subunit SecG [Phyllobacterium salinisoli]
MQTVIIAIHLLIVLALVGVVLIQRSEGGGLGIGGGSGFMTARGAANALTRTTAILAAAFFATSIILGIMAHRGERPTDILDRIPGATGTQNQAPGAGGVLNQLGGPSSQSEPAQNTPTQEAPAQPATPANPVPNSQ